MLKEFFRENSQKSFRIWVEFWAMTQNMTLEPNKDKVIKLTKNSMLISSEVISFEVGNALMNLHRKQKITEKEIFEAYRSYTLIPLRIITVDVENALKIAYKYKIYAYDAYYLEIADRLKMPLITFDVPMKRVAFDLKINIPEVMDK